uniref:PAP-associated domain-containing protein n=1 Tax=Meloidogyne javanica TaxID=6303 RepID=A0A915M2J8_MELJA
MDEYTVNELYKVKTSPNAHKIFKILDDRKSDYRHSFKKYTKSVQDYIVKNRQPDHERKTRIDVWKLLRKTIEPFFGDGSYLAMGGSTLTNLATKGADLDLCFAIRCEDGSYTEEGVNNFVLSKIHRILEQKPFITGLRHICARVPIVTVELAFPYMDVKVDINFSLMIIHFLQCGVYPPILPNLFKMFPKHFDGTGNVEDLDYAMELDLPKIPKNERTIGELIYGFFDYYTRFNYDEWGISIKDGKIFDRNILPDTEREYMFFIEEAYDGMTVPKNLKRQSNLMEIVGEFKQARLSILKDICENYPPPIDETEDYRDEFEEENNKILKRNNEINNLADNW